jgi:hypothetical protein
MFDILCVAGVLALCYLGYYIYSKVFPVVKADASKIEADVVALKPTVTGATGATGPAGATGA